MLTRRKPKELFVGPEPVAISDVSTNSKRELLIGILLALGGVLLFFFALEIGVRLWLKQRGAPALSDRPSLYYFPELSHSARDYFYPKDKPANTYRIVVVGDSFAFGFNNLFDDAFPQRLERLLNLNASQPKVEVLNFGTPGYSTFQETKLVNEAIHDYHADLVVLEVTLNDAELSQPHFKKGELGKALTGVLPSTGIFAYSKALAFVVARIRALQANRRFRDYFIDLFRNPEGLTVFKNALGEIAKDGETANVPVFAVVFPLFSLPLDVTYPFSEIHQTIHSALDQQNIPFHDLLSDYAGMNSLRLQADPGIDPHPNEIAHRIAATAIYRELAARHLVPEAALAKLSNKHRAMKSFLPDPDMMTPYSVIEDEK